jgi:ribonuclease HI
VTNNEVEAYGLFEGIRLTLSLGLLKLIILGDSTLIIRVILKNVVIRGNVISSVLYHSMDLRQ